MRPHEVPQEWVETGARALDPDAWEMVRLTRMELGESPAEAVARLRGEASNNAARVLAALIPTIRASALKDHAADAYKVDRTNPDAVQAWLLRAARQEAEK